MPRAISQPRALFANLVGGFDDATLNKVASAEAWWTPRLRCDECSPQVIFQVRIFAFVRGLSRVFSGGARLDLWLPALGVLVAVTAIAAAFWYRKRKIEHPHASLERAAENLGHIETALDPFLRTGDYIPERVRKPSHE